MSDRRAVVVTGASTGIGEAIAKRLDPGHRVFAGVRKDADAEKLRAAGANIEPIKLDVTDQASIDAAARLVKAEVGDDGLAGLVNNAGIAVSAPLEFLPIDELRQQLEVNVVGQVAVTQAFLAPIRAAKGRIVNIGSIGGKVAFPLAGAYAASKFAMEAITDSLRRELLPWGIEVVIVEPGGVVTPIWDRGRDTADRIRENAPPEAERLYGGLLEAMLAQVEEITRNGMQPGEIAEVVHTALTAGKPKTRYLVGKEAKQRARAAAILPDRVFDRIVARTLKWGASS
jgi:NAD(P)-dependent dehydrogenase (short-subunit alcohol dehydrogenase family)